MRFLHGQQQRLPDSFHAFTRFQNNLLLICVCFNPNTLNMSMIEENTPSSSLHYHFRVHFSCAAFVRSAITSIIYILNTKHSATNEKSHLKVAFKRFHCAVRFLSGISFFSPFLEPTFKCQVFFPLEKRKQWKNYTNEIKILAHNHRSPTFNHETLGIKYKCHALHQSSGSVCTNNASIQCI